MGNEPLEATETRSSEAEEEQDVLDRTMIPGTQKKSTDAIEKLTSALTEDKIERMNVNQLKEEIRKLDLRPVGKKQDLKNILKSRLKSNMDDEIPDDERRDEETMESESDEDSDTSSEDERETNRRKKKEKRAQHVTRRVKFTIKDVDESMAYFTGDDRLSIEKWISDFEELSTLLEWNEVQMLLYGKRMLKGSAKQFIMYEKGVTTWKILKKRLKYEFKTEINSAIVHAQLAKRKRKPDESARQYVSAMQEIASQGNVEDEALIEHIINGIQDDEINKTLLYGAYSLHDMRKRLEVYDRRKEKTMESKKSFIRREVEKKKSSYNKTGKIHCYGCGSIEHGFQNCPNKEKGLKCFNCNNFGHVASQCPEGKRPKRSGSQVNCVKSSSDELLNVRVNNVKCKALVDTGSDVSLIRQDLFGKLDKVKLRETSRTLTGFGNARIIPIGQFDAELIIDDHEYAIEMLVVPSVSMTAEVIIGRNFLARVELSINRGVITVKAIKDSERKQQGIDRSEVIEKASDIDEEITELLKINFIEKDELSNRTSYNEKIKELIASYKPDGSTKTAVETKIILRNQEPIYSRPRRLSPKEKDVLSKQIKEWLSSGVIHPSSSEYASPVVIVPKKSGEYRVCVDYRKINKQIIRDRFPMPLIEDSIDALAEARVFSVLDLKNGFFHVGVEKNSQKYTSFVTPSGQYEFAKTPFGLSNSPTSFLRFIHEVFKDLVTRKVVFTYMDDLIVPGVNNEDAFQNLVETLKVAEGNSLQINWQKSTFLQTRVEYLGYEIEGGYVYPSPAKVKAVKYFPTPVSKKQIQSFLGLTGYFRKFIRDYAKIARPLSDVLKDNIKFNFGTEQLRSFEMLKSSLANKPVLRIYSPVAVTELHTDASKEGYGAILLQKDVGEKHYHPVYFMSRKTSDAEKNYHSYELEILAVIKAVQKFRVYLLGVKFKLITDCDALRKTLYKPDLSPKVARWALILEEFEFEVEHRPGLQLPHVDALSRYPVLVIADSMLALVRKKQEEDERIRVIKQVLQTERYEDYVIENGIVMKRVNDKSVIVLPASLYTEVIRKIHENGHFGIKKMIERIKDEYYIPNLASRVEKFISCCVQCVLAERKKGKTEGKLMPIPKGDCPLSTYHIDHLGPMSSTSKAYKYIFVITDGFSKFVWLYPTKTTNAREVLDKLMNQQKTFGNPARVISDRGAAFTSAEFKEYCDKENIEHILVTTGVPRGNGQVERINRIIIPVLTKLCLDNSSKWYRMVDRVQRSINSTYQRSVGMSPFELMFGIKMRQAEDIKIVELIQQEVINNFDNERSDLRNIAKENLFKIQEENRRLYDRKCKASTKYVEGDLVAIKKTQFDPGSKLKAKFLGPYRVSKVKRNDRYEVIRVGSTDGPRITTTAADCMKKYIVTSSEDEEEYAGMAE